MSSHRVSFPPLPNDSFSGATSQARSHCKIRGVQAKDESHGYTTTIDTLPDDVLLEIFDSYRINIFNEFYYRPWKWHRLVHICRRWREIIFAYSSHLHLRLRCRPGTPVRKHLSCWPALPIVIDYYGLKYQDSSAKNIPPNDEDNVIAALEHSDRVYAILLIVTTMQLAKLATVMEEPFPALTFLRLASKDLDAPVLSDGFLGTTAPCLQELSLEAIPFPALPTLLLSARNLVALRLSKIPPTGYISPEAMVTGLAALARLGSLSITFEKPTPRLDRNHRHPPIQIVLPALTSFRFEGVSDYLEDLVARIDCPRLSRIVITYRHQHVQVSQLFRFINSSEDPRLSQFRRLAVCFEYFGVTIILLSPSHTHDEIHISFNTLGMESGVSHLIQVFDQFSSKLTDVRHLSLGYFRRGPKIHHNEMVQLLHPLTTVQTLIVSGDWMDNNPPALENATDEMVAEVLPVLGLLCFNRSLHRSAFFKRFLAVRRHSGHPVTFTRDVGAFLRSSLVAGVASAEAIEASQE